MIFYVILFVFSQNRVQIYNEIVYVVLSKVCKFFSFLYFLTKGASVASLILFNSETPYLPPLTPQNQASKLKKIRKKMKSAYMPT